MDNLFEQLTAKEARALAEKNNKTLEDLRHRILEASKEGKTGLEKWLGLSNEEKDGEIVKKCVEALMADGFEVVWRYSPHVPDFNIIITW